MKKTVFSTFNILVLLVFLVIVTACAKKIQPVPETLPQTTDIAENHVGIDEGKQENDSNNLKDSAHKLKYVAQSYDEPYETEEEVPIEPNVSVQNDIKPDHVEFNGIIKTVSEQENGCECDVLKLISSQGFDELRVHADYAMNLLGRTGSFHEKVTKNYGNHCSGGDMYINCNNNSSPSNIEAVKAINQFIDNLYVENDIDKSKEALNKIMNELKLNSSNAKFYVIYNYLLNSMYTKFTNAFNSTNISLKEKDAGKYEYTCKNVMNNNKVSIGFALVGHIKFNVLYTHFSSS